MGAPITTAYTHAVPSKTRNTYLATPRENSVLHASYFINKQTLLSETRSQVCPEEQGWKLDGWPAANSTCINLYREDSHVFLSCFFRLLFSLSYLTTTCALENIFSNIYFILTINKSLRKKNAGQLSRRYYLWPTKFIAQNAHARRTKTK